MSGDNLWKCWHMWINFHACTVFGNSGFENNIMKGKVFQCFCIIYESQPETYLNLFSLRYVTKHSIWRRINGDKWLARYLFHFYLILQNCKITVTYLDVAVSQTLSFPGASNTKPLLVWDPLSTTGPLPERPILLGDDWPALEKSSDSGVLWSELLRRLLRDKSKTYLNWQID